MAAGPSDGGSGCSLSFTVGSILQYLTGGGVVDDVCFRLDFLPPFPSMGHLTRRRAFLHTMSALDVLYLYSPITAPTPI